MNKVRNPYGRDIMSISVEVSNDGKSAVIKVEGRFDFSVHNEFHRAYKDTVLDNGVYNLDLSATEYLDSSALGMLLLLKEYAESNGSSVKISNANHEIMEILQIASFDKLFALE
jgi:anti-anti-sigma factor